MKLFAHSRFGSMMPELILQRSLIPCEVVRMSREEMRSDSYRKINPVAQIPTLVLDSGEVMTESLAICTYLDALKPTGLFPQPPDAGYAKFLRWSVFLNTNIYGIAAFADHPDWWVSDQRAQNELRDATMEKAKERWRILEENCGAPYFLGDKMSFIDVILAVMTLWDPGIEFFKAETPKLLAAADRYRETPDWKAVIQVQ